MIKKSLLAVFAVACLIATRFGVAQAGPIHVPILLYHHVAVHQGRWYVSPQKLEDELRYLSENGYHTISMAAYLDAAAHGAALPEKSVVLTFDDGYRDNYDTAFPLLKKYGMTGTFFIVTGLVGYPAYMTWDQIAEMHRAGMEIGAHTVHHPFLTHLSTPAAFLEIFLSRLALAQHLHTPINVFAYPYNDHNSRIVMLARLAGFEGAVTVARHKGDIAGDPFEIPRITVLSGERLKVFEYMIAKG
jgi:peptidoglycan/xylan/chitin deacetylase (PgdA/CDA1 family)